MKRSARAGDLVVPWCAAPHGAEGRTTCQKQQPVADSGLHRSVLGRRPPSVFGIALAVVVTTFLGMVSMAPAGAIGVGGDMPIGLTPNALPNGQSRPYFDLTVAAGQSTVDSVVVTNEGTSTETIKVSPSLGVTSPDSGSAFQGYFKPCTGVGCWITGLPSTVTLVAGSSQTMSFTVTVPGGTGPRQYLAGITAEPNTRPLPVTVGSNGKASAKAIIIHQIDIGVAVTVGTLAQLTTNLKIPTVTSSSVGSTLRLGIHVQNHGQTFAKATGTALCTAAGKQLSFPVTVDTVLPNEGAVVPVNTPGLPFGSSVPCTVHLNYSSGLTSDWQGTVSTPTTTQTTIVHTGPGIYSTLPVGGIPTWAVALMVIGVLIVVGIIVLLLVVRRRNRGRMSDGGSEAEHARSAAESPKGSITEAPTGPPTQAATETLSGGQTQMPA